MAELLTGAAATIMRPDTTLFTFTFQSNPSIQSVQLIGSWDNFTQSYPMQRDVRRGRGQWRGCHTFNDICDNPPGTAAVKRQGGLIMGHTYYYYYELDNSVETHDTSLPSTTSCPYMPGQPVNTMTVPVEQALRHRSASLSSMRITDFKTMNPETKYVTPRPPPAVPSEQVKSLRRLGSSPVLKEKSSTRSLSPAPAWKRFFSRKLMSRDGASERGRSPVRHHQSVSDLQHAAATSAPAPFIHDDADARSIATSSGSRSRDISPESLRRFLSDDPPSRPGSNLSVRPTLVIPEDIPEDNDDDDNFATSAVTTEACAEPQPFITGLSPPPIRRSPSAESITYSVSRGNTLSVPSPVREVQEAPASAVLPSRPKLESLYPYQRRSNPASPSSPLYHEDETPNCYDLTDDEDDVISSNNSDYMSFQPTAAMPPRKQSFECYSLPEDEERDAKTKETKTTYTRINSPSLVTRSDSGDLLSTPLDTSEFGNDLSWVVDMISNKRN